MKVPYKKLNPDATAPKYATEGAAGFDLCAIEPGAISTNDVVIVGTGLAFAIPLGYVLKVYPRSGLGTKKGLILANTVGVIDSDYRGEVKLALHLQCEDFHGPNAGEGWRDGYFAWDVGDRLVQGVIVPYVRGEFEETNDLDDTARGARGFGSTGVSA